MEAGRLGVTTMPGAAAMIALVNRKIRMPRCGLLAGLLLASPMLGGCIALDVLDLAADAASDSNDSTVSLKNSVRGLFGGKDEGADEENQKQDTGQPEPRKKYPNTPSYADLAAWDAIKDSPNADDFKAFLAAHPDSIHAWAAEHRIAALGPVAVASLETRGATRAVKPEAAPEPFPEWIAGTWDISCAGGGTKRAITYAKLDERTVRIDRRDRSAVIYDITLAGGTLTLAREELIFKDRVVSESELQSFAYILDGRRRKVDLTYHKCPAPHPPPAATGADGFPQWLLGTWDTNCGGGGTKNAITYERVTLAAKDGPPAKAPRQARVVHPDKTGAVYDISDAGGVLTLSRDGLVFKDRVINPRELRSLAYHKGGAWHLADVTYRKCRP